VCDLNAPGDARWSLVDASWWLGGAFMVALSWIGEGLVVDLS